MKQKNYVVSGTEVHEILGPYLKNGQTAASGPVAQCKEDCETKYRIDTEKLANYNVKQLVKFQDLAGLANNYQAFFWCGSLTSYLQPGYELPYEKRESIVYIVITDSQGSYLTDIRASSPDAISIKTKPINLGQNKEIYGVQLNIDLKDMCTSYGSYNDIVPDKTIILQISHSVFGNFELNARRKCYNTNQFCYLRSDGVYINPTDKSKFYDCINGITIQRACAPGLEFDPDCNCCNWPKDL